MLPGLGHPELRNSEQHSSEKERERREEIGNENLEGYTKLNEF